jgi:AraC-like DNA-binding protein
MSAERDTLAADIAACRRCPMGEKDFDSASAEGAAMSTEEAIAYAQRGRGERKRPTSGWPSLTPTERDVVRLVSEGLGNFGCRPAFTQPEAGFTLPTADFNRTLKEDPLAHQAVVAYLATLVTNRSTMSQSVRAVVRHMLPTGAATREVMAAHFQLHPKAFQRRLAEEGTTYAALVNDVRRETAERYLRDTDITFQHLTRELGYAEQSELSRSCRRWFGSGPSAYRKALSPSVISNRRLKLAPNDGRSRHAPGPVRTSGCAGCDHRVPSPGPPEDSRRHIGLVSPKAHP